MDRYNRHIILSEIGYKGQEKLSKSKDEQLRIAVSLVQNIPYDWDNYYTGELGKYPYEVLYQNKGVCGEKSQLIIFLLREVQ